MSAARNSLSMERLRSSRVCNFMVVPQLGSSDTDFMQAWKYPPSSHRVLNLKMALSSKQTKSSLQQDTSTCVLNAARSSVMRLRTGSKMYGALTKKARLGQCGGKPDTRDSGSWEAIWRSVGGIHDCLHCRLRGCMRVFASMVIFE